MRSFVFYKRGIEYKSFYDEELKAQRYFIKGHINSSDLDLVNDIVTKGCRQDIDNQFKSRNIKLDFDHETLRKGEGETEFEERLNLTKIPLGKSVVSEDDEKGNLVEFELNPNWKKFNSKGEVVMTFKEVWANIKSGFFDSLSIAFVPVKTINRLVGDVKARLLEKINLINVALTGNPINPSATLTNVFTKSLNYISEFEDLKSEIKEIKNMIGDIKMVDETEIKHEESVEEEVKETPEKEEVVNEKSEPEQKEDKKEENPEQKSTNYVEEKSFVELKSRIDGMEKSLNKIEEILSKAIPKSKGAEDKSMKEDIVDVNNNTLDLI